MAELFLVNLYETRQASFWVRADSREQAREDAVNLADGWDDWDEYGEDIDVVPERLIQRRPVEGELIWSGGPDGDFEIVPTDVVRGESMAPVERADDDA